MFGIIEEHRMSEATDFSPTKCITCFGYGYGFLLEKIPSHPFASFAGNFITELLDRERTSPESARLAGIERVHIALTTLLSWPILTKNNKDWILGLINALKARGYYTLISKIVESSSISGNDEGQLEE